MVICRLLSREILAAGSRDFHFFRLLFLDIFLSDRRSGWTEAEKVIDSAFPGFIRGPTFLVLPSFVFFS